MDKRTDGASHLENEALVCPRCNGTDTEATGDPGGILCWRCGRMFIGEEGQKAAALDRAWEDLGENRRGVDRLHEAPRCEFCKQPMALMGSTGCERYPKAFKCRSCGSFRMA